eukprot:tig00000691_g3185.t1
MTSNSQPLAAAAVRFERLPDRGNNSPPQRTSTAAAACVGAIQGEQRPCIVIYGGSAPLPLDDLWAYDVGSTSWIKLSPRGPAPPRLEFPVFVYARGALWLWGGCSGPIQTGPNIRLVLNDTMWRLNPQTWTWVSVRAKDAKSAPAGRSGALALVDEERGRLIVFGGCGDEIANPDTPQMADLWIFSFVDASWAEIRRVGSQPWPEPVAGAAGWLSPDGSCFAVYGGRRNQNCEPTPVADGWLFHLGEARWERLPARPDGPGPLEEAACASFGGAHLLFGGAAPGERFSAGCWAFDLAAARAAADPWRPSPPPGHPPHAARMLGAGRPLGPLGRRAAAGARGPRHRRLAGCLLHLREAPRGDAARSRSPTPPRSPSPEPQNRRPTGEGQPSGAAGQGEPSAAASRPAPAPEAPRSEPGAPPGQPPPAAAEEAGPGQVGQLAEQLQKELARARRAEEGAERARDFERKAHEATRKKLAEAEAARRAAEAQLRAAEKARRQAEAERDGLRSAKEAAEAAAAEARSEAEARAREEAQRSYASGVEAGRKLGAELHEPLRARLKAAEADAKEARSKAEAAQKEAGAAQKEAEAARAALARAQKGLEQQEALRARADAAEEGARREAEAARGALARAEEEARAREIAHRSQVSSLEAALETGEEQQEALRARAAAAELATAEARGELEATRGELARVQEAHRLQVSVLESVLKKRAELQMTLQVRAEAVEADAKEARSEAEAARAALARAEEELRQLQSRPSAFDARLKASEEQVEALRVRAEAAEASAAGAWRELEAARAALARAQEEARRSYASASEARLRSEEQYGLLLTRATEAEERAEAAEEALERLALRAELAGAAVQELEGRAAGLQLGPAPPAPAAAAAVLTVEALAGVPAARLQRMQQELLESVAAVAAALHAARTARAPAEAEEEGAEEAVWGAEAEMQSRGGRRDRGRGRGGRGGASSSHPRGAVAGSGGDFGYTERVFGAPQSPSEQLQPAADVGVQPGVATSGQRGARPRGGGARGRGGRGARGGPGPAPAQEDAPAVQLQGAGGVAWRPRA